jgi:hypothetical protein
MILGYGKTGTCKETYMAETIIDKMGIGNERNGEIIKRLSELLEEAKRGSYISTSRLISLIADEPSFTKKECIYIGILLAAMYGDAHNC